MKIAAIIQARMSSRRLPGKVLRVIGEKPLLGYLLDSLGKVCCVDEVIIATSEGLDDAPIARFAHERGVVCFRGELNNVARRLYRAAIAGDFTYFFRVNGDSPLLDYRLINRACKKLDKSAPDLVTNVHPRTFPKGQSVELIRTASLAEVLQETNDFAYLEDVTPYFYVNESRFCIESFQSRTPLDHLNHSVDTLEDFERISHTIASMPKHHTEYSYTELERFHRLGSNSGHLA
jgi:spore coat polysaccharide biosynthesis protein SpsF (cytidylyltransferase family)